MTFFVCYWRFSKFHYRFCETRIRAPFAAISQANTYSVAGMTQLEDCPASVRRFTALQCQHWLTVVAARSTGPLPHARAISGNAGSSAFDARVASTRQRNVMPMSWRSR